MFKTKDWDITVKEINLEQNMGHAHARNVAMKSVEAPYFVFVDSDDYLASYALSFYMKDSSFSYRMIGHKKRDNHLNLQRRSKVLLLISLPHFLRVHGPY